MPASALGTNAQHLTPSTWPLQPSGSITWLMLYIQWEWSPLKGGGTYRLGSGVLSPHLTSCLFSVVAVRRGVETPLWAF